MDASKLKDFLRFERPVVTQDRKFKSAVTTWEPHVEAWGEVQDVLPSRGDTVDSGVSMSNRPARVRTRWIDGATGNMRIVMLATTRRPERTLRIVSGPAELGRMDGMEFMVEDWGLAGKAAP